MTTPPAGWYDDPAGSGGKRWYDGAGWTAHVQAAPAMPAPQPYQQPQQTSGPMTAGPLNVQRQVVYNRQQKPHSLTKWILLTLCGGVGAPWLIYYSVSPNHYWTA